MSSPLFEGGLPTGPDIRRLDAAFPNLDELRGSVITHEHLEGIIGQARSTARYRTVISAWKKKCQNENRVSIRGDLREVVGIGYKVLSASEEVQYGVFHKRAAGRSTVKSIKVSTNADDSKLTPQEIKTKEHTMMAAKMMHTAYLESRRRAIALPSPQEALPQTRSG